MTRFFEPYMLTIAGLFALAAGLTFLWDWDLAAPVGLGICAALSVFMSWCYAHAPEMED